MDTIGQLVGGVVHDFNNLLTIILGYGEIVLEDSGGNASNRELIGEVLDAGKRAPPSCATRPSALSITRLMSGFCGSVRRPSKSRVSWK